ncbi:oxidoreductase [Mycobacterium tuberculosis]|uniref:Oxidoreductase n=1 Tax=Mycobacterium tuberculosis TaxID=1773 RepID=A0A916PDF5_MYCTX|nr:oxidoreductase [Mycobacterium tuberculosis]
MRLLERLAQTGGAAVSIQAFDGVEVALSQRTSRRSAPRRMRTASPRSTGAAGW